MHGLINAAIHNFTTGPVWNTASGSLGSDYTQRYSSFSVSATDPYGSAVKYSLVSGSLPTGQGLNKDTGQISGTPSGVADYSATTFNFTIRATNIKGVYTDRAFSIYIASRYIGYRCTEGGENALLTDTAPGSYYFNRKDFSAYGTPNGTCGGYSIGSCNSTASNAWNPGVVKSYSFQGGNGTWGDPCPGTGKYCRVQMSYGVF